MANNAHTQEHGMASPCSHSAAHADLLIRPLDALTHD